MDHKTTCEAMPLKTNLNRTVLMQQLGRVLLIDDDLATNFLSARTLRQANAATKITAAENGREALELLEKEAFNFILLDVNMPEMNGLLFLEALQQLKEGSNMNTPIVVLLTTSESYLDCEIVTQCHMVKGFLTKPLTKDHINYLLDLANGEEMNAA